MNHIILSDVHGEIYRCKEVCKANPKCTVVQLGDLGVGPVWLRPDEIDRLPINFRFFVGNHDCRELAKQSSRCLGDFGEYGGFFFVSGADSIDRNTRTEGISWWPDEELSKKQGEDCVDGWIHSKANIIVSHDCPQSVTENLLSIHDKTWTRQVLQMMMDVRKPEFIIFGHHHRSIRTLLDGVGVIGLGIGETYELTT